jgi:ATP phosphoribosyltransferase regulatory subunit
MLNRNWRLPEGVEELLPPQAWALEQVRRRVVDVFHAWGFDYVEPPIIEYLDALLVGTGAMGHETDLDLQTLKVVDQRSGRMLGVRADMTAQAVRIDAHSLAGSGDGVRRLCYAGPVVHANPAGALDSRVPIKAGAEIFGSRSLAADAEVLALLVEILDTAGVPEPVVVLGHMGVYLGLVEPFGLEPALERELFAAVQSKSETDIALLLDGRGDSTLLERLPTLMGDASVLGAARELLGNAPAPVRAAIEALEQLAIRIESRCPELTIRFDLAELAGYGYHNGPIFSAYQSSQGQALARGGRYDGIGSAFGKGRPATGFDVSLMQLLSAGAVAPAVWAPWAGELDAAERGELELAVRALRQDGFRVVASVCEQDTPPVACNQGLQYVAGAWQLRDLKDVHQT